MVRLVCFDVGGVIVRICRSWPEGCAAAGLAFREPPRWEAARPALGALAQRHQTGRIGAQAFAREVSTLLDGLYSPAEILGIHRAWLLAPYEGLSEIIGRLHEAGLETAALSNINHDHWCRMAEFPAVMRIRSHLTSHRLGLSKPDPAFYRRLEQQLGFRGPEILFMDDLAENVEAARSLGWRAERIDPHRETAGQILSFLRAHGIAL